MTANNRPDRVGEQPRAEQDLSEVLNRTVDIAPGTAKTLLPNLLETIRLHLGMEVGFLSRFDSGRRIFEYVADDGEHTLIRPGDSDELDDSYCLRVVEGRIPGVIHNARQHDGVQDLDATHKLGIGAHISVPVHVNEGELFGTLCCFSTQPDETLNERDLGFMSVISELIGTMLQRECSHLQQIEKKRAYLDEVIHSGTMRAVWQPVIDIDTDKVISVEALARFNTTPYRPPNEWFDEAAEVNRHIALERNALIKGLAILSELPDGMRVGCNLSGQALLDSEIRQFLDGRALDRIVLEITEHDIIDDYEALADVLGPLRAKGMMLAIDDFGAGYASFRHILHLDPDIIKLDLKLVRDIDTSETGQSVVRAMSAFAQENRRSLVAEGVETEAELQALRSLGVSHAQGYLLHKPLERDALLRIVRPH